MQLLGKNVILKTFGIEDIKDYRNWYSTETDWQKWDAPWIKRSFDENSIIEVRKSNMAKDPIMTFEIYSKEKHLGWVNAYYMDDEYIPVEAKTDKIAIGLDIPNSKYWSKGIGTEALELFINYLKSSGLERIYIQTWSGNIRMIKLAEKLGFHEVNRYVNKRIVNDKKFDALTFIKEQL